MSPELAAAIDRSRPQIAASIAEFQLRETITANAVKAQVILLESMRDYNPNDEDEDPIFVSESGDRNDNGPVCYPPDGREELYGREA
jgi:hypothetical protein